MPNNDTAYEYSFLVHYVVNNILTVEWDDQWRWGTIQDGTGSGSAAAFFGMIKHQKTQGLELHRALRRHDRGHRDR